MGILLKLVRYALIPLIFIFSISFINTIFERTYHYPNEVKFGVTFTPNFARYLKLDWQKTYLQILDELKVKNLRLPSYWNVLERKENEYDYSETDFMISEAAKRGVKVILVVGARQPRWPECHIPTWAKTLSLNNRQQKILQFIEKVVTRYKDNQTIEAWQVENEPLLGSFGAGCDAPNEQFLKSEIELVRKLTSKPIVLIDSGELGGWEIPIKLSDIFGISIYRTVYNPVLGYQNYPLPPVIYNLKSALIKGILGKSNQKTIIAELQAEPWLSDADSHSGPKKQYQLFAEYNLKDNVEFAKKTGFSEIYLWGVEWWYFMAKNGYPQYLEYAKTLF